MAQLPGWTRSAKDLECLAIPLGATIDQFEVQFDEMATQRRSLTERIVAEYESIRQLESRLQSVIEELQQDVPTEEMLASFRQRRDQGWRLIKAAWLDKAQPNAAHAAFVAEFSPQGTLASAYEHSVELGDETADRLRREADRVARKAESLAQLNLHRAARAALIDEMHLLSNRLALVDQDWHALINPLGVEAEPRTPNELRAWLRQRETVIELREKADEARQSIEPLERAFNAHRPALLQALEEAGTSRS